MYIISGLLSVFLFIIIVDSFSDNWADSELLPKELKKTNARVLIGKYKGGQVFHNFLKYHHMLVAGHTGYGKTNFIKGMLEQISGEIILIDLKGGFDYRKDQLKATDVRTAAVELWKVVDRMKVKRKKHIYVVIDEAYEFVVPKWARTKEEKDPYFRCQHAVSEIARLGRSFKVHLIYCTQYPTKEVLDGQIKQNMEARIVFRLPTEIASRVALDEQGAEELPSGIAGRAFYKRDYKFEIQTYEFEESEVEVLDSDYENGAKETERTRDTYTIG